MKTGMRIGMKIDDKLLARPTVSDMAKFGGWFTATHKDAEGNIKYVEHFHNVVTEQGINRQLDVMFHATAASGTWYIGLIGSNQTVLDADTMLSHTFIEVPQGHYTGDRKEWGEGAASGKSMTNATAATFVCTTADDVYGAFLCSAVTASGAGDILYCGGLFAAMRSLSVNDQLEITYTLSGADDGV